MVLLTTHTKNTLINTLSEFGILWTFQQNTHTHIPTRRESWNSNLNTCRTLWKRFQIHVIRNFRERKTTITIIVSPPPGTASDCCYWLSRVLGDPLEHLALRSFRFIETISCWLNWLSNKCKWLNRKSANVSWTRAFMGVPKASARCLLSILSLLSLVQWYWNNSFNSIQQQQDTVDFATCCV